MADVAGNNHSRTLKEALYYLDMRTKIIQFLTHIGKFAVDSTIFSSLKAATGRNQVHKIVQEGSKDTPLSSTLNDKKPEELKLVMDKMQAKLQEAEEHKNKIEQHHNTSARSVDASEPLKKLPGGEGTKGSDIMRTDKKRIFIRSRL